MPNSAEKLIRCQTDWKNGMKVRLAFFNVLATFCAAISTWTKACEQWLDIRWFSQEFSRMRRCRPTGSWRLPIHILRHIIRLHSQCPALSSMTRFGCHFSRAFEFYFTIFECPIGLGNSVILMTVERPNCQRIDFVDFISRSPVHIIIANHWALSWYSGREQPGWKKPRKSQFNFSLKEHSIVNKLTEIELNPRWTQIWGLNWASFVRYEHFQPVFLSASGHASRLIRLLKSWKSSAPP